VLVTAPYFHDGSMETLWDAVDHYNKGDGLKDPWLDDDLEPLALTENEIDDLVAFMASLTSPEYKEIGIKELARQRALARLAARNATLPEPLVQNRRDRWLHL
jgi:cytochrome c peroxidase